MKKKRLYAFAGTLFALFGGVFTIPMTLQHKYVLAGIFGIILLIGAFLLMLAFED